MTSKILKAKSPLGRLAEDRAEDDIPESIQVCVRLRPLLRDEVVREEPMAWMWEGNVITQAQRNLGPTIAARSVADTHPRDTYQFDHLFTPEHTNTEIYSTAVHPIIGRVMQGLHGSIFTYGQTSSGKTFTMNGSAKQPGIIPQTIYDCFEYISSMSDREFLFRVSYLEVYNETVNDLLNPQPSQIKIMHDPKLGTVLSGVKEQIVMTAEQVIALLQGGEAHRHVGSTDMNEKSSRAHTLFRLIVESKERSSPDKPEAAACTGPRAKPGAKRAAAGIRVSTLNLIDLAGSENAKMANTAGKLERGREGKCINQSLLALSTIIQRLSEEKAGGAKQHIPYRDSKLTRILQAPLSGNAMICIICTVSPSVRCAEESHNTLKFASRAKRISVDAKVNESFDEKALLRKYREEIDTLTAKLAEMETMVKKNKLAKEDRGSDESEEEDENKQEIMLQMIDHMERLILKGGADTGPGVSSRTPRRSSSAATDAVGMISGRGSRSGPVKSESSGSGRSPTKSEDRGLGSRSGDSGAGDVKRSDTFDDPFHDLPSEGGDDETDFFVGRQRLNSHDLKSDSPVRTAMLDVMSRPHLLQIPVKRSTSLISDGSSIASPKLQTTPGGDSSLLGVQQMLSLLRGQVTKPKHHHHRALDDMDTPSQSPVDPSLTPPRSKRRHSLFVKASNIVPQGLSSEFSTPMSSSEISPKGSTAGKTPDALRAEELTLDLKLKNADNNFLQDELNKARLQIEKKDKILAVLTEGLKEVEVSQSQLVASRDDLAGELDMARDAYHHVVTENQLLREELKRLKVWVQMEMTMKNPAALSQLPSFVSFSEEEKVAGLESPNRGDTTVPGAENSRVYGSPAAEAGLTE